MLLTLVLAGCGSGTVHTPFGIGGGGLASESATPTPAPVPGANGTLKVLLAFQTAKQASAQLPAAAAIVVAHLLDATTGADVVAPITVRRQPGQIGELIITFTEVPPGNVRVFAEIFDANNQPLGYTEQIATVQAGSTTEVDPGEPVAATALRIVPSVLNIPVGATAALSAALVLADSTEVPITAQASWTSATPAIATVSASGGVTGVSAGQTIVQAGYSGLSAAADVVVTGGQVTLDSIEVTPTGVSLAMGQTRQFTATGHYSDASTQDLSSLCQWSSSNTAVATVSLSGLVTAVSQGSSTMRAEFNGVAGETAMSVPAPVQPTTWSVRAREPKKSYSGVAHGGSVYIAVDNVGRAWRSSDALTWGSPAQVTADQSALNDVTFGDGLFVAVGSNGQAYTSPDGATWTLRDLNSLSAGSCPKVAFGASTYVVTKDTGARSGAVLWSSDGLTWTLVTQHDIGTAEVGNLNQIPGLAYVNGKFVGGGAESNVYHSADGRSWSRGTIANPNNTNPQMYLRAVTGGNGVFLAGDSAGYVIRSADAINWSEPVRRTGATLDALAFGANLFVMFNRPNSFNGLEDQATLKTSPDGLTWTTRSYSQRLAINRCQLLNGQLVAVGETSDGAANTALRRAMVLVSQDALTWTAGQGGDFTRVIGTMPNGSPGFVAPGQGGMLATSGDGATWTWRTTGSLLDLVGAASGAGRLVVAATTYIPAIANGADAGKNNYFITSLLSSSDGTNWTEATLGLTNQQTLDSVAFGNGLFVAVGGDWRNSPTGAPLLLTSTDGLTWTPGTVPAGVAATGRCRNVQFVNGRFFVSMPVSANNNLWMTSTDGTTWTALTIPGAERPPIASVGYQNGRYLIADTSGMGVATSTNGTTWTWATFTGGFSPWILARGFAGVWVGVNRFNLGSDFNPVYAATLGTGTTGLAWTERFRDTQESSVSDLTFANGTWVGVGARSFIVTSTP